jgi:hypothetical protein
MDLCHYTVWRLIWHEEHPLASTSLPALNVDLMPFMIQSISSSRGAAKMKVEVSACSTGSVDAFGRTCSAFL